ncbi:MAG: SDR family oxidoreductase [Bryobacterales bacterium]|nr:SDR family oxidoreductase [Bryobacterales bacterium]
MHRHRIVIAGAAGDIGQHVSALFSDSGATLHLLDIQDEAITREANAAVPQIASIHCCDTSRRSEVERVADRIGTVDVLIDATGIWPRDDWMAPDWDAAFDRVIDINVRGPINLVRAFLPRMVAQRYGRIVLELIRK